MEKIEKPWGHELIFIKEPYVIKHLFLNPKSRLSLQYHELKTESMMLAEGICYLQNANITTEMKPFQPYHISPGTIHRIWTKRQSALIIEVSTPHLEDIVRLQDDYGR